MRTSSCLSAEGARWCVRGPGAGPGPIPCWLCNVWGVTPVSSPLPLLCHGDGELRKVKKIERIGRGVRGWYLAYEPSLLGRLVGWGWGGRLGAQVCFFVLHFMCLLFISAGTRHRKHLAVLFPELNIWNKLSLMCLPLKWWLKAYPAETHWV